MELKGLCRRACRKKRSELGHFLAGQDEQTGNHDAFSRGAILVGGGLKRLTRRVGEAIEVEAVIPIRPANQRQLVGSQSIQRVLDRPLKVFEQGHFGAWLVFVGHQFIKDGKIPGFLHISCCCQYQPVRVVIEIGTHIVVAAFGQRGVLVESAAVGKLGGCQIKQPFAGALRHNMHKTQQILGGIAKAHAASNPAFKVRSRTAHVEGDHALVGIPDVDHAVGVFVWRDHHKLT